MSSNDADARRVPVVRALGSGANFNLLAADIPAGTALQRISRISEGAATIKSEFPDVCLHLLDCFEKAYAQDSAVFPFAERLDALRARFADVKN